jgi:hypothetical protein
MIPSKSTEKLQILFEKVHNIFGSKKMATATYFEIRWSHNVEMAGDVDVDGDSLSCPGIIIAFAEAQIDDEKFIPIDKILDPFAMMNNCLDPFAMNNPDKTAADAPDDEDDLPLPRKFYA